MGIKIEDFLRNTNLPKRYFDVNFDISEKYKEEASSYLKLLRLIDGSEFEAEKQNKINETMTGVIKAVEENFKVVSGIFEHYENANPKAAQEELDILMQNLEKDLFIASIDNWVLIKNCGWTQLRITPNQQFYRVRGVEEETPYIQNNPNELFHIPLSKKAFSNNERFSIAGFPSLYLSSMLPLAWQECGYPAKYYYSEFQYEKLCGATTRNIDKEFKFLALYAPEEIYLWGVSIKHNNFDTWLKVASMYVKQYPLVLACGFVNHGGRVSYKQEYIIPQMLMQWVQRNRDKVQGISYFTCSDISMYTSKWCAYNVVIPAQKPYDENMYSVKLKEDFCWSKPQYFQVPLVDGVANKADRETLYAFIGKIQETMRNVYMPMPYRNYLIDVLEVCVCVYNMLLRGKTTDMQLLIHTINLINQYYRIIAKHTAEEIIQSINKEQLLEFELLDYDQASKQFKDIVNEFTKEDRSGKNIYGIINKYRDTIWNDFGCNPSVIIWHSENDDIQTAVSWMHENHIIHGTRLLKPDDSTIRDLKSMCENTGVSIDDLWGCHAENDEWMKQHIQDVKTPIFVRANNVSIYSPVGSKLYDYLQIGFDIDLLSMNLL